MTYISIRTDKRLSPEVEDALRADIGDAVHITGKAPSQCMIEVASGLNIKMADGTGPCVFVDVRFAVMPDDDSVRAFAKALSGLFIDALAVDVDRTYMVFSLMGRGVTGPALKKIR